MIKRLLIIGVLIVIFFISIIGCSSVSNLEYTEVYIKKLNKRVAKFIMDHEDSNGVYIFYNSEKEIYLFLNNANVEQGDKAGFYEDVKVEDKGDTIAISFNEYFTSDYDNVGKNKLIYRINVNKDFDFLKVYKNGIETYVDVAGS